jgi:hypothetical protein
MKGGEVGLPKYVHIDVARSNGSRLMILYSLLNRIVGFI